ncbi:MAG: glycosyltransferase family 2 protein [bacterium]
MMNLPFVAVIPAYNAAGTIQSVVTDVNIFLAKDSIIVVNDGSTDDTGEIISSLGVRCLQRETNAGKGAALREGFRAALTQNPDWVICLDADGQHDPRIIPRFQEAAASNRFDLIIGNRRVGGSQKGRFPDEMPKPRRFSNSTSSALLSWRTGLPLADVQCGYRAIRASLLARMRLCSVHYEIDAEMILQAWRQKGRIGWIPVPTLYRGEPSYLRKLPETLRFLGLVIRSFGK